jgi:hypothetical protein
MLFRGNVVWVDVGLLELILKNLFKGLKEETGQADGSVGFGFIQGFVTRLLDKDGFGFTP